MVKLGNKVKTNLPNTIRYVINPEKNDGGRLVYASYSSERHDANMLAEPMIRDLERCANGLRKDGVLALHLKHSFSPDEHVNAEQVHEMGVMLAEAITGGDYKYVVSTHMDRHHLHNRIVICAANRRTGRKMRLTRKSIDQWRAISDELCRREGLAVLENPKVETAESRVRDERERLKNERKRIREDIAEQVERESERMRRRLKESSDRQRERDKRILFALCLGVCSAVVPMFAVVMQGRWQAFADSLLDWLRMCGRQLAVVGQWLADIDARLDEIILSGWRDRPLVFLLMLLLAAVVCGMPLLVAGGYAVAVFTTMRGWLTEGTLGVHIVLWTLAAMVGFVLADRLAMIPHNPVGWPAWWILLTVAAHLIYLAKLAGPISRFIRNS
ncbi:relaxase/mobilization nuclease domain-containing protein [Bifidobacterium catenulatum subsp. kashiwanohense]|nr:relaxase/mobilization nuclease domain-containing protein [Bifidobacterium catenulatum subsp. kashiwanohense]